MVERGGGKGVRGRGEEHGGGGCVRRHGAEEEREEERKRERETKEKEGVMNEDHTVGVGGSGEKFWEGMKRF